MKSNNRANPRTARLCNIRATSIPHLPRGLPPRALAIREGEGVKKFQRVICAVPSAIFRQGFISRPNNSGIIRTGNPSSRPALAAPQFLAYTRPMDANHAPASPGPAERALEGEEVDRLLAEMAQSGQKPVVKENIRRTLKLNYSHDAMIDAMLANPAITLDELSAMFSRSRGWISTIRHSDAFMARMEFRRQMLVDPLVKDAIDERLMGSSERAKALLHRSLEVLQEKLEGPAASIPDNLALRAAEFGAKTLGLGGNAPQAPAAPPTARLEELADRLIALQNRTLRGHDVSDATIIKDT